MKNLAKLLVAVVKINKMDKMKKVVFLSVLLSSLIFVNCKSENPTGKNSKTGSGAEVIQLSTENFKKLIFNYDINKQWKYEGSKPAIIDFYADWCSPCRQLSPMVEEIARQYEGKIVVYKVNTDKERTLSQDIGITGLPTLLFIPTSGKPRSTVGLISKETLLQAVNEVLLIK